MKYTTFLDHVEKNNDKAVMKALSSNSIDPSKYSNRAVVKAASKNAEKTLKLLLKDNRVNPCAIDNCSLQIASDKKSEKTFLLLLKDERIISSLTNDWVEMNIRNESHKKLIFSAISIYNF